MALLSEDAWVKMPPMPFEYQGRDAAARFFTAMSPPRARTLRVVYSRANGQPAFAAYAADTAARACGDQLALSFSTLTGDLISEVIRFDSAVLASFGLALTLPDAASQHPT